MKSIAATLALGSAVLAQTAQAAAVSCITPQELRGGLVYVLPAVTKQLSLKCGKSLPANAYLLTRANELGGQLLSEKEAAWPYARQLFMKFADKTPAEASAMASVPDEVVRPMLDAMVQQEIAKLAVKPTTCQDVENVARPLSALSAQNIVDVAVEIIRIVARDDKGIPICR